MLPGCSFWADNVVAENYAPADGLSADLPDLKVRNLLIVGSEEGAGVLSASLFNQTSEALAVRITIADGVLDATVEVPADGRLTLTGAGGSALDVPGAPTPPAAPTGSEGATGTSGTGSTGGAAVDAPSAGAEPGVEGSPGAEGGSSAATEVVVLESLPVLPGGAVTIGITSPGGGTVTRTAPVVLDHGPYQGFIPTPAATAG